MKRNVILLMIILAISACRGSKEITIDTPKAEITAPCANTGDKYNDAVFNYFENMTANSKTTPFDHGQFTYFVADAIEFTIVEGESNTQMVDGIVQFNIHEVVRPVTLCPKRAGRFVEMRDGKMVIEWDMVDMEPLQTIWKSYGSKYILWGYIDANGNEKQASINKTIYLLWGAVTNAQKQVVPVENRDTPPTEG